MQTSVSAKLDSIHVPSGAYAASPQPKEAAQKSGALFAQFLQQVTKSESGEVKKEKQFETLMADLHSHEEQFGDQPTRENFEHYRKTVRALCEMILQRAYRLQSWSDKKNRYYEIVKIIQGDLSEIYSSLLHRNQNVIISLHLMGEIRGLLLEAQA